MSKRGDFMQKRKFKKYIKTYLLQNNMSRGHNLICANGMFIHFCSYMPGYNQACHATMSRQGT